MMTQCVIIVKIEVIQMKNETQVIQYRDDWKVVQANELIRSKKDDLTLLEAKIIRLAVTQICKDDTDIMTYTCKDTELADFLGLQRHNVYKELDEISDSILTKLIYIKDKTPPATRRKTPNYEKFQWISHFKYKDGVVTFRLNDDLKPYLIGLNELFTEYPFAEILSLPTANSISLFELLASYRNMAYREKEKRTYNEIELSPNEYIFSIDFLRQYFNCEDKYKNTGDFMRRIIDISERAINTTSPIALYVTHRSIKRGAKIEAVIFKVTQDYGKQLQRLRGESDGE